MMKEQQTSMSAKQFYAFLKTLNWPLGVAIGAFVLALFQTIAGLIVPLMTKGLVDSFGEGTFTWTTVLFLVALFIVQAVAGGFSLKVNLLNE